MVKNLPANSGAPGDSGSIQGWEDAPEKGTDSSTLAWTIPRTEEPSVHGVHSQPQPSTLALCTLGEEGLCQWVSGPIVFPPEVYNP